MSKLTHNEHKARAMLMGRHYDWRDGTYCRTSGDGRGISANAMLDCETLEHMDGEEADKRQQYTSVSHRAHKPAWDKPEFETPWARMDDEQPPD